MDPHYLLDTNICIYIAKYRPPAVRERFARHSASELAMSVITLAELRFRAEKSQARKRAIAAIEELTGLILVYDLVEPAGDHYGKSAPTSKPASR
ncbi:PIN domain-containing protein [Methylomonas sp. LWB]|uniref:PIN domain-containing protein n=1 Tax=Methylomonas sp. LWB TaxID=1905845 RepID=UPI000A959261|nr:PIN domain-containing protein [Methylomonas sp. LWB]